MLRTLSLTALWAITAVALTADQFCTKYGEDCGVEYLGEKAQPFNNLEECKAFYNAAADGVIGDPVETTIESATKACYAVHLQNDIFRCGQLTTGPATKACHGETCRAAKGTSVCVDNACKLPEGTSSGGVNCDAGEAGCTLAVLAGAAELTCDVGYSGTPAKANAACASYGATFTGGTFSISTTVRVQ